MNWTTYADSNSILRFLIEKKNQTLPKCDINRDTCKEMAFQWSSTGEHCFLLILQPHPKVKLKYLTLYAFDTKSDFDLQEAFY